MFHYKDGYLLQISLPQAELLMHGLECFISEATKETPEADALYLRLKNEIWKIKMEKLGDSPDKRK
jgi:hypothetical protein